MASLPMQILLYGSSSDTSNLKNKSVEKSNLAGRALLIPTQKRGLGLIEGRFLRR